MLKTQSPKISSDSFSDCMLCLIAFAQGRQITGTVLDSTGEPVIGANVTEIGTTNGTITDIDGKFTLPAVSKGAKSKSRLSAIFHKQLQLPTRQT